MRYLGQKQSILQPCKFTYIFLYITFPFQDDTDRGLWVPRLSLCHSWSAKVVNEKIKKQKNKMKV